MQNITGVKPDEFRVGDVVWCLLHGKGEVTYIHHHVTTYPVEVYFEGGDTFLYTQDGRYSEEFTRTLFFSEPKIEASVVRPFVPVLEGKHVIVETEDIWVSGRVFEETPSHFNLDSGHIFMKDLCIAIYEVSSENLLTK